MVRGDPVCRKEECSQYDIGLVFKEMSSYRPFQGLRRHLAGGAKLLGRARGQA